MQATQITLFRFDKSVALQGSNGIAQDISANPIPGHQLPFRRYGIARFQAEMHDVELDLKGEDFCAFAGAAVRKSIGYQFCNFMGVGLCSGATPLSVYSAFTK